MVRFILRRVVQVLITIVAASSFIFVLIHLAGDPTDGFLAPGSSDEVRTSVRARLGLDRPLPEQYLRFIGNSLRGDFGESWRDRQPALETVLDRLPSTLLLGIVSGVLAVVGGGTLGVLAAMSHSALLRFVVKTIAIGGQAVPAFWLGTLGIVAFAVRLGWLPSSGDDGPRSLVLPVLTLAAQPGSMIARLVQTSLLDVRASSFVAVARSKGLSRRMVWLGHMLPNAVIPSLGYVGFQASLLVGGAVVIETVFAYPGVGRLALQATADRDVPVIHAFVVVAVLLVSLINVLVDLVARMIDPRQRERAQVAFAHG